MRLADLQLKDIVNIKDGRRLGRIIDAEIDSKGQIINIIIEPKKIFKLSSNNESNITFNQIVKIGEDVILVEL